LSADDHFAPIPSPQHKIKIAGLAGRGNGMPLLVNENTINHDRVSGPKAGALA
jgi:hypothetical protein